MEGQKKKYNHKVKQIFTGISESLEPHLKSPEDDGSPGSNPQHYTAELCSALQESWIPGPLLSRGRDFFPKTVLTFEGSIIPSSSARKKTNFCTMETPSKGEEKVMYEHSGGRSPNTHVQQPPNSRQRYSLPDIHYPSPEKWHNRSLQIKQLVFPSLTVIPKAPLAFPSQFSSHFPQHWMCTVLSTRSKHDQVHSVSCAGCCSSKTTSTYTTESCVMRAAFPHGLEKGVQKSWNTFSACGQDWPLCH